MSTRERTIITWGSIVVVVAAVGAGLFVLGAPAEERAYRLDERRIFDMRSISSATDLYWTRHGELPASLAELADEPGVQLRTADPATAEPYTYQSIDSLTYEVCAVFDRATREVRTDGSNELWAHGPGRQCFRQEAQEVERDELVRRGS